MPEYPNDHLLVTFGGTSWAGAETWQYGLRLAGSVPPSETEMDDLQDAASLFHSSGATKIDGGCLLTWIKVASIGTDGLYPTDGEATLRELTTPVAGSGTAQTFPQITLVVSLTTAKSRGLAHGGRFYPPPTSHAVGADGRIAVAYQGAYRDAAKTFIDSVNDVGLGPVTIFSKVGTGASNVVTGLRVGRVFDTQRRRRSSLPEEWSEVAVSPG